MKIDFDEHFIAYVSDGSKNIRKKNIVEKNIDKRILGKKSSKHFLC